MTFSSKIKKIILAKKKKLGDYNIFQDWKANKNNPKGRFVMVFFRVAHLIGNNMEVKLFLWPILPIYTLIVEWIFGIEIRWPTKIGPNMRLWHGQSIVVNGGVVLGKNCLLRQCVTIGNNGADNLNPIIGDFVEIGANSCIIGNIKIGNNVKIGAGSIVLKDVPANCVVAGNPAKMIKNLSFEP